MSEGGGPSPPRIGCCPSLPLSPAWSPAGAPRAAHTQASEPSPGPASLPGMLTPSAPSGPHRGAASSRKPPRCISSGCHSKLVRTWLKTTEIHSLALLRADRAATEGFRENPAARPASGGSRCIAGRTCIAPVSASVFTRPPSFRASGSNSPSSFSNTNISHWIWGPS